MRGKKKKGAKRKRQTWTNADPNAAYDNFVLELLSCYYAIERGICGSNNS